MKWGIGPKNRTFEKLHHGIGIKGLQVVLDLASFGT